MSRNRSERDRLAQNVTNGSKYPPYIQVEEVEVTGEVGGRVQVTVKERAVVIAARMTAERAEVAATAAAAEEVPVAEGRTVAVLVVGVE